MKAVWWIFGGITLIVSLFFPEETFIWGTGIFGLLTVCFYMAAVSEETSASQVRPQSSLEPMMNDFWYQRGYHFTRADLYKKISLILLKMAITIVVVSSIIFFVKGCIH